MERKNKYEKPIEINMGFNEMMQRLSQVDKSKVDSNIKKERKKKNGY